MNKRILLVQYALAGGGIENLLYSYLTHMNREGLTFELVVCGQAVGQMEQKFKELGCVIHHIPHRNESLSGHYRQLRKIIRNGRFDAVHANQSEKSFITLFAAWRSGVKTRILHCHNAFPPESLCKRAVRFCCARLGMALSTRYFACSTDAGRWLFGERAVRQDKVQIIKNAIDLTRFSFDEGVRKEVRAEQKSGNAFVVGNVARMTEQKNHSLTLQIFEQVLKTRKDAQLWLIGEGELEEKIRREVNKRGLSQSVRFMGVRTDVPRLMQAMDAFLLPSRYEGLGIVFLEAQAAGLTCVGPDIPGARDTAVTPLMHALRLDAPVKEWADEVLKAQNAPRTDVSQKLRENGYDIMEEAGKLEKIYRELP